MSRAVRVGTLGFLIAWLAAWLAAPVAGAAGDSTIHISDVKTVAGKVQGVLTFQSSGVVSIDNSSVKAAIDGHDAPITIQPATHLTRSAMLAIDTSGSMGASGITTVRAATATFLGQAPADVQVGVVTFANTAGVDLRPTHDRAAVQRVVNGLVARGNTSLYAAMQKAAEALGANDGDRSIVLLSDGADTMSKKPSGDLARVAQLLKDKDIRVEVVRFNNNDPVAIKALQQFAGAAGGSIIAAKDAASVGAAFEKAARALQSQAQFVVTLPKQSSGKHSLTITGAIGGTPFSTSQTVKLLTSAASGPSAPASGTAPALAPAAPRSSGAAPSSSVRWIAAVAVGLALFMLGYALLGPSFQTGRERRLSVVEQYVSGAARAVSTPKAQSAPITERLSAWADRRTKGRKWTDKTTELLDRADLPFRAGEWLLLRGAAIIAGVAVGTVLFSDAKVVGILVGLLGGLALPTVFLRVKAHRRAAAFERLLPQALLLASTSLRSGFSLGQALDAVATDSPEPVAKELSRALAETRIGTDIADALDRVSLRMATESMKMTVMAIRIQREVGGNLAETLETTARTLREREALHGQVRALSAEGRLSAYILIALPIGIFLYMMMVNYAYVSMLWTTALGLAMLIGAIVMMVAGVFWMRKTVQIEV